MKTSSCGVDNYGESSILLHSTNRQYRVDPRIEALLLKERTCLLNDIVNFLHIASIQWTPNKLSSLCYKANANVRQLMLSYLSHHQTYLLTYAYRSIAWNIGRWQQSASLLCPGPSFPAVSMSVHFVWWFLHQVFLGWPLFLVPCGIHLRACGDTGDRVSECVADPSPAFSLDLVFCRFLIRSLPEILAANSVWPGDNQDLSQAAVDLSLHFCQPSSATL